MADKKLYTKEDVMEILHIKLMSYQDKYVKACTELNRQDEIGYYIARSVIEDLVKEFDKKFE